MSERAIDCKGLACPIPIVRISQAIQAMQPGDILSVEADDPAFPADIRAWAQMTGHELLSFQDGAVMTARLKCHG